MARVTVEDCLEHVDNRFQLVHLASKRARHLMRSGESPMVPWDNDKATVVALREIAEEHVGRDFLEQEIAPPNAISPFTAREPRDSE